MKLSVPGRICLFGEHTDWAGGYRTVNPGLEKGYAILVGTNQLIHAEVQPHPDKLILTATLEDGTRRGPHEIPMEPEALKAEAEGAGFFSYVAGVAFQIVKNHPVQGLIVDNYRTELPIRKGLSSSAAICVLVARAFNRIYKLGMSLREEMEAAYQGEITTPSRCGRLDQGCAYGNRPILMVFDGDDLDIKELHPAEDLFYVIVDLMAGKDTREILEKLNAAFPVAESGIETKVQKYLGPVSAGITLEAIDAMESGDTERLGALMNRTQEEFDRHLIPACPSQLEAPILHKVLEHESLRPYVLGGKGVGSQGDGAAQFLVRDRKAQKTVMEIVKKELDMPSDALTVRAEKSIRKAVIPAAGLGTRFFPASKAVKKELFPIIDGKGRAKPVVQAIVEEALSAGIEDISIIVRGGGPEAITDYFHKPLSETHLSRLSPEDREYARYVEELGRRIIPITQASQDGFGHAVFCARDQIGDEPFLLLLGDHLYVTAGEISCASQLLKIFRKTQRSVVGLQAAPADRIHRMGCVTGRWGEPQSVLNISAFKEKPDAAYAREHLQVQGLESDHFLCLFGLYILTPGIFAHLDEIIRNRDHELGEVQLTTALDRLREAEGVTGYVVQGKTFDVGNPEGYTEALKEYRQAEGSTLLF
ncbi:sugar phosphate nucleotidyltransferase [Acidobacteriota bacterium]